MAGYGVEPGDLGENITTAGIDLETLPLDTELRIGDATIRLTGLRTPCVLIDRFRAWAESASDRSGLGAAVSGRRDGHRDRGGLVVPGDDIRAILPATPRRALPAI